MISPPFRRTTQITCLNMNTVRRCVSWVSHRVEVAQIKVWLKVFIPKMFKLQQKCPINCVKSQHAAQNHLHMFTEQGNVFVLLRVGPYALEIEKCNDFETTKFQKFEFLSFFKLRGLLIKDSSSVSIKVIRRFLVRPIIQVSSKYIADFNIIEHAKYTSFEAYWKLVNCRYSTLPFLL